MKRLLLVEDDQRLSRVLARGLREEGFEVEPCADGATALDRLCKHPADVCVLDVRLPKLDGFSVLEQARAAGVTLPILVLTAQDETSDRVRGLNLGADDYLVKPFAFAELLARIQAVLRRSPPASKGRGGAPARAAVLECADLRLDPGTHRFTRAGTEIALSQKQFALLEYLLRHGEAVVTREQILRDLWGYEFDPGTNVVDVHVASLRSKIDRDGKASYIRTIRGAGYAMSVLPHGRTPSRA
jgi:DNA-binding response OmpR family regulator